MKLKKLFYLFINFLIVISVFLLSFRGLNLGIDFKGGTLVEVTTKTSDIGELRSSINISMMFH